MCLKILSEQHTHPKSPACFPAPAPGRLDSWPSSRHRSQRDRGAAKVCSHAYVTSIEIKQKPNLHICMCSTVPPSRAPGWAPLGWGAGGCGEALGRSMVGRQEGPKVSCWNTVQSLCTLSLAHGGSPLRWHKETGALPVPTLGITISAHSQHLLLAHAALGLLMLRTSRPSPGCQHQLRSILRSAASWHCLDITSDRDTVKDSLSPGAASPVPLQRPPTGHRCPLRLRGWLQLHARNWVQPRQLSSALSC